MRLYHFSDRGDIAEFAPRAPLRHPDSEPFVYAIDDWHAPLYLFPRDCPRIGVWPLLPSDQTVWTGSRMRLLIDARFEQAWRSEGIYRYEFSVEDGFVDCHDHGVWVSKATVRPLAVDLIGDLPAALDSEGITVEIVPSLAEAAREFFDFDSRQFTSSLHVSMVRMALLPDWKLDAGKPVQPNPS